MESQVWTVLLLLIFMYPMNSSLVFPPTMITINTALGKIRGMQFGDPGANINIFLGVPYAEPPKRFKKPIPSKPWADTINALTPGKICNQIIHPQTKDLLPSSEVSEDCLRCDIYAPVTPNSDIPNKAVLIWLIQGSFQSGQTGLLPMKDLAKEGDIVVVTVSYRLGVFGFLSTGDNIIPGNFGLWDQKMAIEWVKENINSFGGDPNRITVAGIESGAVSASLQAITPLNFGKFQRLIIHSTFANSKGIVWHDAPEFAQRLANEICTDNAGTDVFLTSQQIYDCLSNQTDIELTKAAEITYNSYFYKVFGYPFGPVIDNDFISTETDFESFIPVDVLTSLVGNEHFLRFYEKVATMESTYSFSTNEKVPKVALCESFVPSIVLLFYKNVSDDAGLKKLICDHYTNDDETEQSRNALRLLGDFFHYYPVIEQLDKHSSRYTNVNTYLSFFSETSPFNDLVRGIKWLNGSVDSDDLFFLLAMKLYQSIDPNLPKEYFSLADTMIKYWSDFVKTGNPNNDGSLPVWPKYEPSGQTYLNMGILPTSGAFLFKERVEFWRNTVPKYLEPETTTSTTTTKATTTSTTTTKATTTSTTTTKASTTSKRPLVVPKSTTTTTAAPVNSSSLLRFHLAIFLLTCLTTALFYG